MSLLIFFGIIIGFVLGAMLINKIKGVKAHYLDAFHPEAGEAEKLRETGTDFYVVSVLGQARVMSFARLRRGEVLVTNKRIVVGQKVLLGKRYMITHEILLDTAGDEGSQLDKLTGGLYAKGYVSYLAQRQNVSSELDGKKPYLKFIPDSTGSATNIEHLRLYVDAPENLLAAISV
jgi:hypothetical protein